MSDNDIKPFRFRDNCETQSNSRGKSMDRETHIQRQVPGDAHAGIKLKSQMSPVMGCVEEEVYNSVCDGDIISMQHYLTSGLNVNHVFQSLKKTKVHGMSMLHVAAAENQLPMVRLLLRKGCDVNQTNRCHKYDGFRSRIQKVHHKECLQLTVLFQAICSENVELIKTLVRAGADVNLFDGTGCSGLWHAIDTNNPLITRAVLDSPTVDLNFPDSFQMAPLHVAAVHKNPEVMIQLLDLGVVVDPKQLQGATPLYIASRSPGTASIKLLLQHGADPNIADLDGITALNIALDRSNSPEVICILIHAGAFVISKKLFFLHPLMKFDIMKENAELDEYVRGFCDSPRGLKTLSMLKIKDVLRQVAGGSSVYRLIQLLPLPKVLISFLLLAHI